MTPSLLALLLANLVPAAGVLLLDWRLFDVLAIYWSENVVIGAFMVLRIALSPRVPLAGKLFLTPFFAAHYGLFCLVHAVFLVAIFGDASAPADFLAAPTHLFATAAKGTAGFGLLALAGSHGFSFAVNWVARERRAAAPNPFAPYGRVIAMHLVVMAGAFLSLTIGAGRWFTAAVVAVKLATDAATHFVEFRPAERPAAPERSGAAPPPGAAPAPDDDYIAIE